jgi:hypothetical protein
MAAIFKATVYRINDTDLKTPELIGFAPSNVKLRPAPANTVAGSTTLLSIIQERPSGLSVHSDQFYVAENVTALQALANA